MGDLNVVRRAEERLGGNLHWLEASEDLETCCDIAQLEDLRYTSQQLTWSKGEGDSFIARKFAS